MDVLEGAKRGGPENGDDIEVTLDCGAGDAFGMPVGVGVEVEVWAGTVSRGNDGICFVGVGTETVFG